MRKRRTVEGALINSIEVPDENRAFCSEDSLTSKRLLMEAAFNIIDLARPQSNEGSNLAVSADQSQRDTQVRTPNDAVAVRRSRHARGESSTNLSQANTTSNTHNISPKRASMKAESLDKNRTQDDPELISYIGKTIRPPSAKPYNLSHPEVRYTGPGDETALVEKLFGQVKRDGFFVEVGGFDGETWSITLYLERFLGFKGLLIEANSDNYKVLLTKERKAYTINAALSPTNTSGDLLFSGSADTGVLAGNAASPGSFKVKSFPLYSILQSLNVTFVDYFSLDIQGFEFKVLKTIPWDKMKFGLLVVEYVLDPEPHEDIIKYMENLGYVKIYQNSGDYFFCEREYYKKS